MEEPLKHLMQELGNAINDSLYESDRIAEAIGEIKKAAIDDGKDVNDHPAVDVKEHGSRLLRAIETLKKAKQDVSGEEDNPEVKGLRHRAEEHMERALHAAEKAHAQWLKEAKK